MIVRQCVRTLLEAEEDLDVIGEAAEGLTVIEMVTRLRPDVLVLDLRMPGLNGLEVMRQVKMRGLPVRVVFLSMYSNENYVLEALRNGAVGYVLKDAGVEMLTHAIRTARDGAVYLSPALVGSSANATVATLGLEDAYNTVTPREREVLQLAAEGYSNDEIAVRLSISRRTAELHRTRVVSKLRLENQTGLIKFALRKGLISIDV
jgi:two-component system response regulator NreC